MINNNYEQKLQGQIIIPEWMKEGAWNQAISSSRKPGRMGFISRSLKNLRRALSEELLTERLAGRPGLLQGVDPRVKLLSTIILILLAGITRSILLLVFLWLLTIVLMYYSRLPVLSLQKRIWGIIPLITLLLALPASLNIINDGSPLLVLCRWSQAPVWLGIHFPDTLFISRQGALAALYLFLRVGISLSMGVLLTFTTPVNRLLKSLRVIKVPHFFVMLIEMTYRYLVLLLNISVEMFEARSLRTVGRLPGEKQRALFGSSLAALFARSMTLSEEVYQAMTARCYTGEAVSMDSRPWRRLDLIIMFVIIALALLALMGEYLIG